MEVLLVLLGLGLLAIVGHAIWLAGAAAVRAVFGSDTSSPKQQPARGREICPQCGHALPPWRGPCDECGLEPWSIAAHELRDLAATTRELDVLAFAGGIDRATVERMREIIAERRRFLTKSKASPAAVALPAAAPQTARASELPEVIPVLEEVAPETPRPVAEPAKRVEPQPRPTPPRKPARPPKAPRRSVAEVLAAFMEDRNIFWGELVGGLLMVGSSIALVIYLWSALQRIPYFQFLIFVSTTAAVFGAGLYALHRLKLATTSRGLLAIATLLVPLNFLVMAGLSGQEGEVGSTLTVFRLTTEVLSLGIFAALMIPTSRALVPEGRWQLIFAVLGASVSQLAVPRLLGNREQISAEWFLALGLLPGLCHLIGATALITGASRSSLFDESRAKGILAFLGLATFPLLVALGFLTYWSVHVSLALERLSPLVALAGLPILAGGLLIHCRLAPAASSQADAASSEAAGISARSALRTTGTAVSLGGMALMLGAAALAWPQPIAVLVVCGLDFLVLTAMAFYFRLPIVHAAALPCLAAAYLTAFHLFVGHLAVPHDRLAERMLETALSAQSGSILLFLVVLLGVAAELLVRTSHRDHGFFYATASGLIALVSLGLVSLRGIDDPATGALITGTYGIGSLVLNLRYRKLAISYGGLALTVMATLWGLWWRDRAFTSSWATVLATESAIMAAVAVFAASASLFPRAWRDVSLGVLALALALGAWQFQFDPRQWAYFEGPAIVTAFLLAWAYESRLLTWVGSGFIFIALLHVLSIHPASWWPRQPAVVALCLHSTAVVLASYLLLNLRRAAALASSIQSLYARPLYHSALVSSLCALPLVFALGWGHTWSITAYLGWLSFIWLVIAWASRSRPIFTLFQASVTATVFFGVTAWLEGQAWAGSKLPDILENPQALREYSVALAGLAVCWLVARLSLRWSSLAESLFNPPWPSIDWVVLGAVLLGHMGLALWDVLPAVFSEFDLRPDQPIAVALTNGGPSIWILPAVLALPLAMALWTRRQGDAVLGLVLLAVSVPIQIAVSYRAELASASALRWGLAICYLACSVVVWARRPLAAIAERAGCPVDPSVGIARHARGLLNACTAVPVLFLSVAWILFILVRAHSVGALESSIINAAASYAVPLLIVGGVLSGYALRERSAAYLSCAGLVTNLAITGGYVVVVGLSDQGFTQADLVKVLQVAGITAAAWGLLWMLVTRVDALQISFAVAANALLLILPLVWLVSKPDAPLPDELRGVGGIMGWLALFASAVATVWYASKFETRNRGHVVVAFGLALAVLAACSAGRTAQPDDWRAYHVLLAAWTGTGLVVAGAERIARLRDGMFADFSSLPWIARIFDFTVPQLRGWLHLIGVLVLALAARGMFEDPSRPYWSAGATLAVGVMAGLLATRTERPGYVYLSGVLLNIAGTMIWLAWSPLTFPSFAYTQVLCLAVGAEVWLVLELLFQGQIQLRRGGMPFAHAANLLGLLVIAALTATNLGSDILGREVQEAGNLAWLAFLAIAASTTLCLWDREAHFTLAGLYVVGLTALGMVIHALEPEPRWLGWLTTLALAVYVLITAALGWVAPKVPMLWRDLHLPERSAAWPEFWFAPAQTVLAVFVVILSLWVCLAFDTPPARAAGPAAVLLLVPAGVFLTQYARGRWGSDLRYATLTLGVLACIEGGWALLNFTGPAAWLYRNLLLMVSLALMSGAYGVGLGKILVSPSAWAICGRRIGPVLGVLATLTLLVVLAHEGLLFDLDSKRTLIDPVAVVAVAVAMVSLVALGIYFAVVPGRDPFRLSERGRMLYVYGAEVLLVLLFIHFKLTVPWIFGHWLVPYWTFVVMGIAFAGVGLSEFFSRRGLRVLAEPLQRTGVFLPIFPLLVFWIHPSASLDRFAEQHLPALRPLIEHLDRVQPNFGKYSLLWFLLGLLYAYMARAKSSLRYALSAALASNAGIWALLYHQQLSVLVHPQLWLVPFALIVLVAEHLNRDSLAEAQSAAMRYAGLIMIYVSSTADMFIAGLDNVLYPVILAVLSLAGVLGGMLLRVRAFVYLGVSFLFLVIVSMIWHAAVELHQGWLWWVSGIVLGAAIIGLFAIFENRRNDVLHAIEQMKKWS
jgi:hypothetical protein